MAFRLKLKKDKNQDIANPFVVKPNGFHHMAGGGVKPIDGTNDMGYDPPDPPMEEADHLMDDPFGDGDVDLSLREKRSDALNEHVGEFWNEAGQTAHFHPLTVEGQTVGEASEPQARITERAKRWINCGIGAGAAILVLIVLFFFVFQITDIEVKGNETISSNDVITLSGIRHGDNIFMMNEDVIEHSVNRNPYLIFVCLEKSLPGRVTIQVKERTPAAYVSYCGILFIIDNRGMVLYSSDDADNPPALLRLEGFSIRNCGVGRKISLLDDRQMSIYMEVMREIKALEMTNIITELYVTDINNIYLGTVDGYSVRMGGSDRIHAKLRALSLTREALRSMDKGAGTIDVSSPGFPTYIPEVS